MWSDDLTLLRSLVAVVDTGSVAAAARLLGYSSAGVSRHVSRIEQELGTPLFHRTARSVTPSVLARVVSDQARLVLDEADQFAASVHALGRGDDGAVRVAYFRAVGTTLLPGILSSFERVRPRARVVLMETQLSEHVVAHLRAGEADIGFVWGFTGPPEDDLVTEPILSDALVLLTAAHRDDLHGGDPGDLSRLVGEPFSGPPEHRGSPPIVDAMFHAQGLPAPNYTHRVSDHAMAKSLISAGIVVAFIPALGISDAVPGIRRSIMVPDFRRVYLAHARGHTNPLSRVFENVVKEVVSAYRGFGVDPLV